MRITGLEITNFKTIRSFKELDLPEGIIGIVGSNGVGKSTLMLAIAYAFYGPEVLETNIQDLISWGEKESSVGVDFMVDKDHYQLRRSHTLRTARASLSRQAYPTRGYVQVADTATAVTQEIEKLIGIDRVGFLASVFSRQEDLLGIGSLQPAKRTSTILRLLGIDQVDKAIKHLAAMRKESQQALETLHFAIPSEIESESDLLKKISKSFQLLSVIKENYQHLQSEIKDQQEKLAALAIEVDAYDEYDRQRQSYQSRIDAYSSVSSNLQEPVCPDNFIEPRDYERERDKYEQALNQYNEAIASAVCPTCKRPFDKGYDKEHLEEQKGLLDHWISDLTDQFADYVASLAYVKERESYLARVESAEKAAREVETARKGLSSLKPVEDRRIDFRRQQEHMQYLLSEDSELRAEMVRLESEHNHLEYRRTVASQHTNNLGKIKELETETLESAIALSQMKALKSKLIANAIPFISDSASRYISELTDGKYTELVLTDQYDIQYRNDQGELKSFANLSGGEKDVFALALRLSIAELRASNIGFLVLDEVFESLDPDRQQATWNLLESQSKIFEQVFLVTHVNSLQDRAPYLINL